MGKTRKRHSTAVIPASAEATGSREVEQLDLLVSPGAACSQDTAESDEHRTGEAQVPGSVSLLGRLGTAKRSPRDLPSVSFFGEEAYGALEYGLRTGPLLPPAEEAGASPPDLEGLSLSEFDAKCVEWCRGSVSKKSPAMWSPHSVDTLVSRACAEDAFFPHHSIRLLLQHGRVTDRGHGLLEKILSQNDLSLLCSYLQHVPDLQESSIVQCLEHIIHADCDAIRPLLQPPVQCDIRERLLWHVFSLDVDRSGLGQALLSLSELDRMSCFTSLQNILDVYLSTLAPSFAPLQTSKGLSLRLPSKHTACRWLAALLDSLYPAIVFDLGAEEALRRLRQGAERDLWVSANYERVRNLVSSLMTNRRTRARSLKRRDDPRSTLYVVEPIFF